MESIPPEIFISTTALLLFGLSKSLFAKALYPAIHVPFWPFFIPIWASKTFTNG
jgi:hypothetical protein